MARPTDLDALLADARARVPASQDMYPALAGPHADAPVLFGAGRLGRKVLAGLRRVGVTPVAFADNAAERWGTEVDGLPVLSPTLAWERYRATHPVVVTIWSPGHRTADTLAALRARGWARVTSWLPLAWRYPATLLPHFLHTPPEYVHKHAGALRFVYGLLGDDTSRAHFRGELAWRLTGDFAALPEPAPDQYFPADLLAPRADERFVDGGAYDGDSLRAFIAWTGGAFESVDTFEPDPATVGRLRETVCALPAQTAARVRLHHAALGAVAGTARFDGDGTMHSALDANGGDEVRVVGLDDVVGARRPTFLKFDIEGAERDALRGAVRLIERDAPVVAVCTDHRPDDLWTLPLLLHVLQPTYRFAFRSHVPDGFDSVLYAIPPHRR